MSVVIETNYGEFTIDLFHELAELQAKSFINGCALKKLNNVTVNHLQKDFLCVFGDQPDKSLVPDPVLDKRLRHSRKALIGSKGVFDDPLESFYITMSDNLEYLDKNGFIFGEIAEGTDILKKINQVTTDQKDVPIQKIRIQHTTIIFNPFEKVDEPLSPKPIIDVEFKAIRTKEDALRIVEETAKAEAATRRAILEMFQDVSDASQKPPDNVLFVCRLNPCTCSDELRLIFSKYGEIVKCDVIRDWKTNQSLQYAFIEFTDARNANNAWAKMQGVIIDDRRIHVDFSQSVGRHYAVWKKFGSVAEKEMDVSNRNFEHRELKNQQREDMSIKQERDTSKSNNHQNSLRECSRSGGGFADRSSHRLDERKDERSYRDRDRDRERERDRDGDRLRSVFERREERDRDRNRYREGDRERERDKYREDAADFRRDGRHGETRESSRSRERFANWRN
eukprot:GDKK01045158.1.p1 GENE.GDKK01045158.1~~GDKK01045158.1.p1  ORF type:complete len:452 (+),score=80.11 GDKK01045158.1:26-1381(+)